MQPARRGDKGSGRCWVAAGVVTCHDWRHFPVLRHADSVGHALWPSSNERTQCTVHVRLQSTAVERVPCIVFFHCLTARGRGPRCRHGAGPGNDASHGRSPLQRRPSNAHCPCHPVLRAARCLPSPSATVVLAMATLTPTAGESTRHLKSCSCPLENFPPLHLIWHRLLRTDFSHASVPRRLSFD